MRVISPGLREALQPMLRLALRMSVADRRAWLDELSVDAPAFAEVLERLLERPDTGPVERESPSSPT